MSQSKEEVQPQKETQTSSAETANDENNDAAADDAIHPNEVECLKQSTFYQSRFPDVPIMTSKDLIQQQNKLSSQNKKKDNDKKNKEENDDDDDNNTDNTDNEIILVDVRTEPERNVSMIPGAISLEEFESPKIQTKFQKEAKDNEQQKQQQQQQQQQQQPMVVTYCTIGYRSGLEARRLREKYSLTNVYSLDGILAYTHNPTSTLIRKQQSNDNISSQKGQDKKDPDAKQHQQDIKTQSDASITIIPTKEVHTFGGVWKNCASVEYEPRLYGFPGILIRLIQVGCLAVTRSTQHVVFLIGVYCCFSSSPSSKDKQ